MTSYPVFDHCRSDHTRDWEPIGQASSEAEAVALLRASLGSDDITVELNDRDVGSGHLWGYWLLPTA